MSHGEHQKVFFFIFLLFHSIFKKKKKTLKMILTFENKKLENGVLDRRIKGKIMSVRF